VTGAGWFLLAVVVAGVGVTIALPLFLVWVALSAGSLLTGTTRPGRRGRGLVPTAAQVGWNAWQHQRDRNLQAGTDPTAAVLPWANARMIAFAYDQRAGEIRDQAFTYAADGRFDDAAVWEQAAAEWTTAAAEWRAWADSL